MNFKQYVKVGIGLSVGFYLGENLINITTRRMVYLIMDNSKDFKTYVEHIYPSVYYRWQKHAEAVESMKKPASDENEED